MRMKQKQFLRCLAEFSDGVWIAYCLDFGLGAQGDTFEEARQRLEAQIQDLTPQEALALYRQSSPAGLWLKYWAVLFVRRAASAFGKIPNRRRSFRESLPPDLVAC